MYAVKYINKKGSVNYMTAIRQEILDYINDIPDTKLEALKPILLLLVDDETFVIETNLTDEEKIIIYNGREEYKKGEFVSIEDI